MTDAKLKSLVERPMTTGYLELLNAEEARLTAELSDIVIARKVYLAMLSKVLEKQECLSGRDERSDDISNEAPQLAANAVPACPPQPAPESGVGTGTPSQEVGAGSSRPKGNTNPPDVDDLSFPEHLKREIGEGGGSLRSRRTPADA